MIVLNSKISLIERVCLVAAAFGARPPTRRPVSARGGGGFVSVRKSRSQKEPRRRTKRAVSKRFADDQQTRRLAAAPLPLLQLPLLPTAVLTLPSPSPRLASPRPPHDSALRSARCGRRAAGTHSGRSDCRAHCTVSRHSTAQHSTAPAHRLRAAQHWPPPLPQPPSVCLSVWRLRRCCAARPGPPSATV